MAGLEIPGEYTDMEISRVGVYSAVNYRFFFFLLSRAEIETR